MSSTKYIRTSNDEIIVFGATMLHSKFKNHDPISAGFISFGIDEHERPTCRCYGESISLKLRSKEEEDTLLARLHLGLKDY